ncbi:hypothetical protein C8N46_102414 [Kordia periserrulae]|uniref:Uncharacterized protein n=1 Tax=Kordia periserrulae TaxID=701523 RepID=A0A2T6C408_9FLAO|nr:hypothetical protein [Kordia periserrulae]PTX63013.1 hypothetical protein C8N46_102414 [Kordia periserrulae]
MKKKKLKSLKFNSEKIAGLSTNKINGGAKQSLATNCINIKACQQLSLYLPINYCY